MTEFPHFLWIYGLYGGGAVSATLIILHDLREKMIPTSLLLLFFGCSLIQGVLIHPQFAELIIAALIGGAGLFIFFIRKRVGLGDCLFLPSCFFWIPFEDIALFLVLCGVFGMILGIFWRFFYKETAFPFTPAILFSTIFILLS